MLAPEAKARDAVAPAAWKAAVCETNGRSPASSGDEASWRSILEVGA
jgi:hypothetical protein